MRFRLRHLPLALAALCTAIGLPLHAQVLPGALPTGWNVTSGAAAISRNGTTLNILQTTPQALVNFQIFNVGSGALVDIQQPSASAALLARTTGGDPSQIYGQIKANGALWLINPAGIMVGAGARIDVARFVASTLNVSDSDFLAGRLTFTSGATAGEVRNAGTIRAASGGSIYLVAPSVTNTGTLNAPHGEVLLAAGQNVQLMDTGTPGVSVAITGAQGEAKNLGRIVAEAGRIGLAAGLVSNGGRIDADSAVSEGGRIFLRASGDLRTSAASDISASGTTGGRVELIADGAASIDGRVAATGSAGKGGYVDTSGHGSLDVVNVPTVGRGGEWHIDPFDIEIVASGSGGVSDSSNAIVSNESGAHIGADTLTAQLDLGTNVSITTGPWSGPSLGNITVSAPIAKTGSIDSTLTLNASNNIVINAPITSSSSALGLNLNSNYTGGYPSADHAVQLNANLNLHGGVLNVSEGEGGSGNGTIDIMSGTTSLGAATSAIHAAAVNVASGATLSVSSAGAAISGSLSNQGMVQIGQGATLDAHFGEANPNNGAIVLQGGGQLGTGGTSIYNNGSISGTGTLAMGGSDGATLFNNGTVAPGTAGTTGMLAVQGSYTQGSRGVLDVKLGGLGTGQFDLLDVDGSARLGGTLNINALNGFAPANAAYADFIVARGSNNGGTFDQVVAPAASGSGGVASLSVSYPAQGTAAARVTAAVVPSLGACTATPSIAGCMLVLPTLASCTATPSLAGCLAVLPTLASCQVSPSLPGCSAVLPPPSTATVSPPPSADICTIAPNSALCQVLSPPTASEPVKPIQQASNEVIKTVTTMQSTPVSNQPPAFLDASSGSSSGASSSSGSDSKTDAKTDTKEVAATGVASKSEPVKKMYCN
ncbi:two-partner secretion domain-containing protein [Variovorax sp. PBL-E5]|uniref:two-partner secretion domain-containing protein n=1 Tax=Variovorax sp. PBL-E5 TaxID=434014 RepID=UPI0013171D6B|nr:filamentous hemagglutinin N-terminal domain-containing protein [Variovorax sp. PBL-E5]VTU45281.1 Heme:hemopexin utilization protein A [Variovorax sp. PBL-E5]